MEFKIDKSIPIPENSNSINKGRKDKYPIKKLQVNESFGVPCDKRLAAKIKRNLYHCLYHYKKQFPEKKYHIAAMENEVRVWRTA